MKKVLSFVLVLAMILGSFSMVFAANFSDVEDGADHEEAINVLSALGVVSGFTDGTFKPEKVVTRAEMAAFLINALFGEDKQITQRATKFSDVTAAHWASGFVDYANTLGIISGYTDGTFKPDQPVAYNEAITMVVKALGYTDDCLPGTYPARYVNQAKALGLLTEVDGLGTAGAVRGDIAQLVYNALECYIGTVNKDGDWNPIVTKDGVDTMLARLGCEETEDYYIVGKAFDLEDAIVDLSAYLGAEAKVIYNTKSKTLEVLGISDVQTTFVTGEYDEEDETIGTYDVSDLAAEYFFINGEYSTASFEFKDGEEYTLAVYASASGKTIKEIVSAIAWDGKDYMVDEDDIDDILDNKWSKATFAENDDKEIDTKSFVLEGVDSLEDIEEDSILTVYVGKKSNTITKLSVSTKTLTGEITKVKNGKTAVVGGEDYSLAVWGEDNLADDLEYAFETEYVLYFNYAGDLVAVTEVEEADPTYFYAVVLDTYSSSDKENWATADTDDVQKIKVLEADGTKSTYDIAKKATLTGVVISNDDDEATLDIVIKYSLNDDGEIKTAEKVAELTSATASVSKKGIIDSKYYFADDAVVFQCTDADEHTWKVVKADSLVGTSTKTYNKADYTVNTKGKVNVMVFAEDASDSEEVYGFFVSSAETKDGYEVSFWVDGEEVSYVVDDKPTKTVAYNVLATVDPDDANAVAFTGTSETTSGAIVVNGLTVVVNKDKDNSYALSADVVVFKDNGTKLLLKTVDDLEDADEITLYDTNDGTTGYEIVVYTEE